MRPALEPVTDLPASSRSAPVRLRAVVVAIIPCLDEEEAIGAVVRDVLAQGVAEVIVVDGGSRDRTAERRAKPARASSSSRAAATAGRS